MNFLQETTDKISAGLFSFLSKKVQLNKVDSVLSGIDFQRFLDNLLISCLLWAYSRLLLLAGGAARTLRATSGYAKGKTALELAEARGPAEIGALLAGKPLA